MLMLVAGFITIYVLHVAVLPTIMGSLIAWHFWRIRKDGGLAKPADTSIDLKYLQRILEQLKITLFLSHQEVIN